MAITVNYFLNTSDFDTATGLFTDSALTICAPDGWYSDGDRHRNDGPCRGTGNPAVPRRRQANRRGQRRSLPRGPILYLLRR